MSYSALSTSAWYVLYPTLNVTSYIPAARHVLPLIRMARPRPHPLHLTQIRPTRPPA
ncbi:uncharacterized protein SCHCODRAFT_02641900 [Schizophyllum commune H4-8]|uniref:uncharacterized protein n=1 Tax=Schizophyllum commune (strain H4-8 / FGSC 9210) TaxID=578458 RepID=UPI002160849B|nr:uncharacterized protein SCHCODRAFT_02641900 [Schizophyllum commune H4-8]KAI5886496.1 hypothetical protein SCHCODRAFT_02641900 [Schizophyllum commune H4-8]